MRWLRAGIVRRLVGTTVATGLATPVIGVSVVQLIERRDLVDQSSMRNLAITERGSTRIDDRLLAIRAQLKQVTARDRVLRMDAQVGTDLAAALRISSDLDQLVLYDRVGKPVGAAASARVLRPSELPPRSPSGTGELWDDAWTTTERGEPAMEVAAAVEDPPGTVIGVLVGRLPVTSLVQEVTPRRSGMDGSLFLTDGDGLIRAHRDRQRVLQQERFGIEMLAASPSVDADIGGVRTIIVGSQLQTTPGWVVMTQPRSDMFVPARARLGGLTAVVLAVVTAIVVAVVAAGYRLLRPLEPLARAVEKVANGDLSTRIAATGYRRTRGARERVQPHGRVFAGAPDPPGPGRTHSTRQRGTAPSDDRGGRGLCGVRGRSGHHHRLVRSQPGR